MDPLDDNYRPTKTISQLLEEGLLTGDGAMQLASAEQMENPPASLAALRRSYEQITSSSATLGAQAETPVAASESGSLMTSLKQLATEILSKISSSISGTPSS